MESEAAPAPAPAIYSRFSQAAWNGLKRHGKFMVLVFSLNYLSILYHLSLEYQFLFMYAAAVLATKWINRNPPPIENKRPTLEQAVTNEQSLNEAATNEQSLNEAATNQQQPLRELMMEKQAVLNHVIERHRVKGENERIGASVIKYVLNYDTGKATINFQDGKDTKASFIIFNESDEEKAKDLYFYTSKAHDGSILRPRLVTHNEEAKSWFLFYEEFTCCFEDWNMDKEFKKLSDLEEWWLKSIKTILKTIKYIHSRGLVHMGLDNPANYAIKGGQLNLINIRGRLDKVSAARHGQMKRNDFKQFRDFIKDRLPQDLEGRQLFLDYFDNPEELDCYVKGLIRHPFLMHPHKKVQYFYEICQAIQGKICADPTGFRQRLNKDASFSEYRKWTEKEEDMGEILAWNFKKQKKKIKNMDEYKKDLYNLIVLLGNVYVCVAESGKYEAVNKEISTLCPGFLIRVHEIFHMKDDFFIN